ncbi:MULTISPECIES: hypothetical protein [Bacteria]|uniref:Uncharacterized protein n=2 Tax=Phikmvvirus TaxID=477967 RepID=A0A6C0R2W8_9CAUD|nr:hypothetical protein [Pseudomonas aeruginosa]MBW6072158.1 hypothetical protein [Pseudomonas aeruginosa]QHZ59712.1 hypothetical protein vBPaePPE3_011 [Pseudomonas phage vB_PaeP_PE3]QZI94226.1 hypothetical protein phage551_00012 [Pseudomonas phage vB_PaeA_55_1W]
MSDALILIAILAGAYILVGALVLALYCLVVSPPFENPTEEQFEDACLAGCIWPLLIVVMIYQAVRGFLQGVRGGLYRHLFNKSTRN